MGTLNEYLADKAVALQKFQEAALADPQPIVMSASVDVRGRSGVRAIRIRQFELNADTDESVGGFDLAPNSPEHQLAALGGCIAHTALGVAAMMKLSIEKVSVDVQAQMHPLAQSPGYEDVPAVPHNLSYKLVVTSEEPAERIRELQRQIELVCPLYNLIRNPQPISGELIVEPVGDL